MARYIQRHCHSETCDGKMTTQVMIGAGEMGYQIIQCDVCAETTSKPPAVRTSRKKTTWPYYHEGCGVTFESESHEQKFAAANKLTKE